MERVLKDSFRLYPNRDIIYDVELFEKCIVFRPCSKKDACTVVDRPVTLPSEVSLDEVIGCHVMKVAEDVTSLKPSVSYFCVYAYHLVQKRCSVQRRRKRTYVFEVDKEVSYEGNLAISRLWQSALLWLLRGVKLQRTPAVGDIKEQRTVPSSRTYRPLFQVKTSRNVSRRLFCDRGCPVLTCLPHKYLLKTFFFWCAERQNHAKEFIKNLNLRQWSGILVISGDGLLFEVYNGLMERPDWEQAVKIPIGIIPGGSGNGLARSISHTVNEPYVSDPIVAATLGVAKGRVSPLDLMLVETPKGVLYSFLTVGWGILADIDIESERLRAIGEIRFTLWAFWRLFSEYRLNRQILKLLRIMPRRLHKRSCSESTSRDNSLALAEPLQLVHPKVRRNVASFWMYSPPQYEGSRPSQSINPTNILSPIADLRTYQGRISYLPAVVPAKNGVPSATATAPTSQKTSSSVSVNNGGLHRSRSAPEGCTNINDALEEPIGKDDHDVVLPAELELVADSSVTRAPEPDVPETTLTPPVGFPSLDDPVPDDWTVEEGRFIIIYSSLQSHLGTNLFFAPEARLDDGLAWLLLIRGDVSRLQVLNYFKAQEEGHHVDLPYVRLIPVRAFRLESFSDSTVTVDGELVRT
ncbi:unnamed protein product, partial [Ixodes hexagonus]